MLVCESEADVSTLYSQITLSDCPQEEEEVRSLPSRRRLPQPSFFRSKCYRLSPIPKSCTPPPLPATPLPKPLPAAHLDAPPLVSAHTLTRTLLPGAVRRQAGGRLPPARSQTRPRTPGTVGQADALLRGAVRRQGGRTVPQSADRDSLTVGASSLNSISAAFRAILAQQTAFYSDCLFVNYVFDTFGFVFYQIGAFCCF